MITQKSAAAALACAMLAATFAPAPAAFAQQGAQQRLSIAEVDRRLSAQGFRVYEVEWDDGKYEVTALNSQNQCRELDVNALTGEVMRDRADDDCYDDDRDGNRNRGNR